MKATILFAFILISTCFTGNAIAQIRKITPKKDVVKILYESDNYFFAKGLFSVNCIKKSKLELSADTTALLPSQN